MDIEKLGEVEFRGFDACASNGCAEVAGIKTGVYAGKIAMRFTETDPNDAAVATLEEMAGLVRAAKDGKLDHFLPT